MSIFSLAELPGGHPLAGIKRSRKLRQSTTRVNMIMLVKNTEICGALAAVNMNVICYEVKL